MDRFAAARTRRRIFRWNWTQSGSTVKASQPRIGPPTFRFRKERTPLRSYPPQTSRIRVARVLTSWRKSKRTKRRPRPEFPHLNNRIDQASRGWVRSTLRGRGVGFSRFPPPCRRRRRIAMITPATKTCRRGSRWQPPEPALVFIPDLLEITQCHHLRKI